MKTWKSIGITAIILASVSWSGVVQAVSFIDQKAAQQEQRIQEGIQSGALTPREAARLQAEQQQIQAAKAQMKADGRLNINEKVMLDQMQQKADQDIYRLKHNHQVDYRCRDGHHEPGRMAERERYRRDMERRPYWGR